MTRMKPAALRLRELVIYGSVIYLIGVLVMALAWPRSSTDTSGLYTAEVERGSAVVATLAAVGVSVGACVLLVGLIGYGVKYGREASPMSEHS